MHIWEAVDLLGVQKESRHVPLGLVGVLLKKSENRYKRNEKCFGLDFDFELNSSSVLVRKK